MSTLKHRSNALVRFLGERKEARVFDRDPIIIGGCGRSGTTLLLSILAAHPDIFAIPHESVALVHWEPDVSREGETNKPLRPARLDRLYRHLLVKRVPRSNRLWCEKTPRNVRCIKNILAYWEAAFFIHIIRDPRDVLTSRHRNDPEKYWVSPDRWVRDVNKGLEFRDHPRVYTIRYEDLVQNFEPTIRKLCAFIGVDCGTEILDWHAHTTVRRNNSWKGKVAKLHANSVRKWELPEYETRMAEIMGDQRILDLMEQLNYS